MRIKQFNSILLVNQLYSDNFQLKFAIRDLDLKFPVNFLLYEYFFTYLFLINDYYNLN